MSKKSINMNESLLECPFSAWKWFRRLFNFIKKFIKQGELVIALISKSYIGREATFKIDQEGKKGRWNCVISLGVRNQFKIILFLSCKELIKINFYMWNEIKLWDVQQSLYRKGLALTRPWEKLKGKIFCARREGVSMCFPWAWLEN